MSSKSQTLRVNATRMKAKLRQLGERATLHPDRKVREGLRDVIQTIHNKHVER